MLEKKPGPIVIFGETCLALSNSFRVFQFLIAQPNIAFLEIVFALVSTGKGTITLPEIYLKLNPTEVQMILHSKPRVG